MCLTNITWSDVNSAGPWRGYNGRSNWYSYRQLLKLTCRWNILIARTDTFSIYCFANYYREKCSIRPVHIHLFEMRTTYSNVYYLLTVGYVFSLHVFVYMIITYGFQKSPANKLLLRKLSLWHFFFFSRGSPRFLYSRKEKRPVCSPAGRFPLRRPSGLPHHHPPRPK